VADSNQGPDDDFFEYRSMEQLQLGLRRPPDIAGIQNGTASQSVRELGHQTRLLSTALCLLFPIFYGFLALHLGQDIGFDTLNYHFFDPFWALHNHFFDITPALWQTYLDPVFNIPTYLLQSSLSARTASFIIAGFQGLAFIPLYLIGRRLTSRRWVALGLAALGMLSAVAWSEVGAAFGDNIVAIFFLVSLALIGRSVGLVGQPARWSIVLAGAAGGVAAGLKLTEVPIALGFLIAIPLLHFGSQTRIASTIRYSAGLLVGFIVSYGYWGYELTVRFGNPVLPFFNNVFHSKFAPLSPNLDGQSVAKNLLQCLFYPVLWAFNSHLVSVISFRELSLPICEVLLWIALGTRAYSYARRRIWTPMFSTQFERFLVVGASASVLIWAHVIGLYRYITSLEMLGFVLLWVLTGSVLRGVLAIPVSARALNASVAALCVVCVLTERPANWGRSPFTNRFFTVSVPRQFRRPGVALLMLTSNPYTYIVPFLPADTDVIRLAGAPPTAYVNTVVRNRLGKASAIYITWTDASLKPFLAANSSSWSQYGLAVVGGSCSVFSTFMGSTRKWVHYCQVSPFDSHTSVASATTTVPRRD
jgi:hypothetical protein